MEKEQTLAIVKPDGIKHIKEIIQKLYQSDLKIIRYDVRKLDEKVLKEHYAHLIEKPFYKELETFMLEDNVVIMIIEGKNAVEKLRTVMGPTDSTKAEKDTIRGMFGTDKMRNVIHGSDSKENAEIEINRFFNQKQKRI